LLHNSIPISDKFEEHIDQRAWLSKHHLDPDRPTILMSAGAFGVSKGFDQMINEILEKSKLDAIHSFICFVKPRMRTSG
jgi:UDP-N-acetylglucosamine:LPS N-acetylglucosamine transferase